VFNCNDGHDESGCPTFFTFDECSGDLKNCHWKEDFPDKVDWIAVSGIDTYFNRLLISQHCKLGKFVHGEGSLPSFN